MSGSTATLHPYSPAIHDLESKDSISSIESKSSFSSADEEQKVKYMLDQLTPDEIEIAARSSFQYSQDPNNNASTRLYHAEKMVIRYLESKKGDADFALEKLKSTINFRQKMDIDGIRQAFHDSDSPYKIPLENMLNSKKLYVQGRDKEGRATYVFIPRLVQEHDAEWTLKEAIYTMERAMACSTHPAMEINAMIDFEDFSSTKHAPPMAIGKQFLMTLREHYRGIVHKIFILNAPTTFRVFWAMFSPFISDETRRKIDFVTGDHQKKHVLSEWYSTAEASKWMLPGGERNKELDLEEYLYETRFDRTFDDQDSN